MTKILSKHIRLYTDVTCYKYFEEACEIRTDVTKLFNKHIRFILILMLGKVETLTDFTKRVLLSQLRSLSEM